MCFRGDLRATERLKNDSICLVENGGIRKVRHNDEHTDNLVYVQNWHTVDGDNEFIEAGELVRYRPYKYELDKKYTSVCGIDDFTGNTKFKRTQSKEEDLLNMIKYFLNHEQLDSNQKVEIIRDTIDICKRIDKIN